MLGAAAARADDTLERPSLLDRSHTVAEAEAGIIALPTAPISASNRGGSTPIGAVGNGDATVEIGAHILYRADRAWAIGAGATFAPRPTSDPNYGGAGNLERVHSRSYLFLGGEFRFFPFRSRWIEFWVGATAGTIIVADRFSNNSTPGVPSLLGTNQITVDTGGLSVGGQTGLDYLITDSLKAGPRGARRLVAPPGRGAASELVRRHRRLSDTSRRRCRFRTGCDGRISNSALSRRSRLSPAFRAGVRARRPSEG